MGMFRKFFKPDIEKMERNRDIEGLIKAMRYPNGGVILEAQRALARVGEPAVQPLIRALKTKDFRRGALMALGMTGDARAIEPLTEALKDEDIVLRIIAAVALGKIGDARVIEPLTQALKDEDEGVRTGAKNALEKIKARAKPPLPQVEKCPSCGVEIPVGAEFCPNCGRRVE